MNRMAFLAISTLWLSQLGCGTECLDYANSSVGVIVHDEHDEPLPGAKVEYAVDGVDRGPCELIHDDNGSNFICGIEEDGSFDIHVTHEGYQPQDVHARVREIGCHVRSESVSVRMIREK